MSLSFRGLHGILWYHESKFFIGFLILFLPPECGFFGTRDEIQELFHTRQPIAGDVRDLCLEVHTCEGPILQVILARTATPEAGFHLSFSFTDKWTEGGISDDVML